MAKTSSNNAPSRKSSFLARSMAYRTVSFIESTMEQKLSSSHFLQDHPVRSDLVNLNREDMTLGKRIGQGAFSDVYELDALEPDESDFFTVETSTNTAQQDTRDRLVSRPSSAAVKLLREDLMSNRQRFQGAVADLVSEAQLLARLDHPHIIKLHGMANTCAIEEGKHDGFFLILDRLDCTLADRIHEWRQQKTTGKIAHLETKLRYARELASAVEYLHEHRLIYRDLKPENIGILNDSIVLFDFGLCRELPESVNVHDQFEMSGVGTLRYMAPEVMLKEGYNHKADIYSFSMVLYELLFHQKPFELYTLEMLQLLVGHELERPKIPSYCPVNIRQLLEDSWDNEPFDRPSLVDLRRALAPRSRFSFFWDKQYSSILSERTCSTTMEDDSSSILS